VTNSAVVAGGGDPNAANNTASDPTTITSLTSGIDLAIAKVPSPSSAVPGQTVTYTVTVSNVGNTPSSGMVTVTDLLPTGLTVTAASGVGWTCTAPTCTRSDPLAPGASYSPITVTTSVGAASGTVTNSAVVSGGGDSNSTNNGASSPVTIGPIPVPVLPLSFVLGLMGGLLAIALSALRARRFRSGERNPTLPNQRGRT
jgi:uncharacterized repeat protein (TIGR01451 family)